MASLIQGYEYDIFISYRQKDNKYDGWVTEFVANLKKELEATFKEDVSIYFDENPHDGLLETHNVNRSLEGKLKSLIIIPPRPPGCGSEPAALPGPASPPGPRGRG